MSSKTAKAILAREAKKAPAPRPATAAEEVGIAATVKAEVADKKA